MVDTAKRLIGTWRLESWSITDGDGKTTHPLGPDAKGLLTYTADGFMFAFLAAPLRTPFAGNDPLGGSAAETHAAMSSCHGYCGTWQIVGETGVHAVEMALFPNMVGTQQVRFWRFDGERVVLRTPPMTRKGASGIAELVWSRAV